MRYTDSEPAGLRRGPKASNAAGTLCGMTEWKEGDRVRVITRAVTDEDRKQNRYFDHMAGLVGTVQNVFSVDQVAIKVDLDSLPEVTAQVRTESNQRMRDKFVANVSDEQRKKLTPEELKFVTNFVAVVRSQDLEAA